MFGKSKEDIRQLTFSTGTSRGFLDITKPLINKSMKDLMNTIKDASDIIESAGGVDNLEPDTIFKLGKGVQDATNELASRN